MGKVPVIELGSDKYTHPKYGVTKVPAFTIGEWFDPAAAIPTPKKGKF
jgi:hypothetical protein